MQLSYTDIPIDDLKLSMTDAQCLRRESYDAGALAELADNIKRVGVLEPIIVRETLDAVTQTTQRVIVAGERRYLAARDAGLETIPARVGEMTNEEVVEVQLVENLQREDLDPFQEAEGYRQLRDDYHIPVDELHTRANKSRAYVYNRLKLLAISPKVRKTYYNKKILLSVALLIARLPQEKIQEQALKKCIRHDGSLLTKSDAWRVIKDRFLLVLKDAPFDAADPNLVPSAPACGTCPKRTGAQPELFGDVKNHDTCSDPICYKAKVKAHGKRLVKQARAEGREVLTGAALKQVAPWGLDRGFWQHSLQGGYLHPDTRNTHVAGLDAKSPRQALTKTEFAELPKTVAFDAGAGVVVELVKTRDVTAVLKAKAKAAGKPAPKKEISQETVRRNEARAESEFRVALYEALQERAPITPTVEWMVGHILSRLMHDQKKFLCQLRGLEIVEIQDEWRGTVKDVTATLENEMAQLFDAGDGPAIDRFIVECLLAGELMVATWEDFSAAESMPRLKALAAERDIKPYAVRRALAREAKAKTASKAKAKAKRTTTRKKSPRKSRGKKP